VATNSFPRNTVVDITNMENGKTIRAIVSAPLENPGLLAVLSKDAAGAIGIPSRSIGRVRMNQPADPVAFSRFTEGLSSSGDPDYDPSAFVAANGINPELLAEEPSPPAASPPVSGRNPPAADPPAAETGPAVTIPPAAYVTAAEEAEEPSVAEEEPAVVPDKTGAESLEDLTIVDLPEPYVPPASAIPDESISAESSPELVWTPRTETEAEDLIEPEPEDMAEVTDAIINDTAEPAELTEAVETGDTAESGEGLAEASPPPADEPAGTPPDDYDLTLIPSEERPPASEDPVIPADLIPPPVAGTGPALTLPEATAPELPPSGDYGFSVPVITELEEGRYYLQLAASHNSAAVKEELAKIGEYWPLKVQVSERDNYPYRILVGPVNQGESRALLQRFKGNYQDAFVRVGN
jgi:hypothetical protein